MKLVPNWKSIVTRSHSMWAVYLGLALLVLPEIWFEVAGYQLISPYITGYGGIVLLVYGAFGRIVTQGIDHD